jgi:hypothetical protein
VSPNVPKPGGVGFWDTRPNSLPKLTIRRKNRDALTTDGTPPGDDKLAKLGWTRKANRSHEKTGRLGHAHPPPAEYPESTRTGPAPTVNIHKYVYVSIHKIARDVAFPETSARSEQSACGEGRLACRKSASLPTRFPFSSLCGSARKLFACCPRNRRVPTRKGLLAESQRKGGRELHSFRPLTTKASRQFGSAESLWMAGEHLL